ncbi:MAG: hypothetical protein CMN32_01885 [Saprospirales bacterium]|nr:hypothetical protein [Saprospirales bacterium]
MNRFALILLLLPCLHLSANAQSSDFYNYIEKYKKIAIKEMERTGIPASIKLAQALLESNAGKSELARKANNHFGLKCHNDWTGPKYHKKDDDYDAFGNLQKSCFRKYRNAEDSYIAHSEFLRDPNKANRYGFLFRLDADDYKRWARGLKRAGYATAANYDKKLIQLIEQYELYRFDQMALDRFEDEIKPDDMIAGLNLHLVNDAKVVFAKNNITPQQISLASGVKMKRLKKYNEQLPEETVALPDGYRVFIQPKRCNYRGHQKWHYVQEGQTMFDISQLYGVKLKKLYSRNRMPEGSEPQPDERIKLSGWKIKKGTRPRLVNEPEPTNTIPNLGDEYLDEVEVPSPSTQPTNDWEPGNSGNDENTKPEPAPQAVYYTVVKGDTLYGISKRFGTTVEAIQKLNNLTGTTLSIGQVLRIR